MLGFSLRDHWHTSSRKFKECIRYCSPFLNLLSRVTRQLVSRYLNWSATLLQLFSFPLISTERSVLQLNNHRFYFLSIQDYFDSLYASYYCRTACTTSVKLRNSRTVEWKCVTWQRCLLCMSFDSSRHLSLFGRKYYVTSQNKVCVKAEDDEKKRKLFKDL